MRRRGPIPGFAKSTTASGDPPIAATITNGKSPPRRAIDAAGFARDYSVAFDIAFAAGQDVGMAVTLKELKVKLFTDGADKAQIRDMAKQAWIRGFTTNPSLLKAAQVSDYASYARELVAAVPDRHISFEVFSDDIPEMVAQARLISDLGAKRLR